MQKIHNVLNIYICFFVISLFCNFACADTTNVNDVKISSPSAIVIDNLSGRILYEKDGYSKRKIASLTKVITAIVNGNIITKALVKYSEDCFLVKYSSDTFSISSLLLNLVKYLFKKGIFE